MSRFKETADTRDFMFSCFQEFPYHQELKHRFQILIGIIFGVFFQ